MTLGIGALLFAQTNTDITGKRLFEANVPLVLAINTVHYDYMTVGDKHFPFLRIGILWPIQSKEQVCS